MKKQCRNCSKARWCGLKPEVGGCPGFRQRKRLTKLGRTVVAVIAALWLMAIMSVVVFANELHMEWYYRDGKAYWVEYGVIQGTADDPKGVRDTQYNNTVRGREIYDPASDGWYWLDACYNGAKAEMKEVWMPYIFQDEIPGSTEGKWVRYDGSGKMVKGWLLVRDASGTTIAVYYYSKKTGAMTHGWRMFGQDDEQGIYFGKKLGKMCRPESGEPFTGAQADWMAINCMEPGETYYTLDIDAYGNKYINPHVNMYGYEYGVD